MAGAHLNYAICHDRYMQTGEGWKFTERVYEIRYLDATALAVPAPRVGGAARLFAKAARSRRSVPSPRRHARAEGGRLVA